MQKGIQHGWVSPQKSHPLQKKSHIIRQMAAPLHNGNKRTKSEMVISLTEKWDVKSQVAMFFGRVKRVQKTCNEILTVPF